jgi:hypothetical protein
MLPEVGVEEVQLVSKAHSAVHMIALVAAAVPAVAAVGPANLLILITHLQREDQAV